MTVDLQTLSDEREIERLCLVYAQALDNKQWERMRDVFTTDAVARYQGVGECNGVDEIIKLCSAGMDYLDRSQHLLSNFVIDVEGDSATSACYLQAQHVREGTAGGENFIMAGRYRDQLVRQPEGWRITQRELDIWWTEGNQAVVTPEG